MSIDLEMVVIVVLQVVNVIASAFTNRKVATVQKTLYPPALPTLPLPPRTPQFPRSPDPPAPRSPPRRKRKRPTIGGRGVVRSDKNEE